MVNIEQALYAHLNTVTGITDLVGSRIYPVKQPQKPTSPGLYYFLVSERGDVNHDGAGNMWWCRFQFNCVGETYESAKELSRALVAALQGLNQTLSGLDVGPIILDNVQDLYDDGAEYYVIAVDFRVIYIVP